MQAMASGQYTSHSLLEHPLIQWNAVTDAVDNSATVAANVAPTLQVLLQRHLTMLECPSVQHAYPVLPAEVIASIVAMPIARSPIQHMNADPLPTLLSTVTSLHIAQPQPRHRATTCGSLRLRDQTTLDRCLC